MDERAEIAARVRQLLQSQRFAALSTQSGGLPYASLVAFVASEDLSHVVFATMRSTRKFGNLSDDPHVAMLFDNRSNQETDLHDAIAATAVGRATVTEGEERAGLSARLVRRHPHLVTFVTSPGCAVVRVDVDTYHTVARFQNVFELHMAASEKGAS